MAASGKPDLLRRYNRDLIRDLIRNNGPVTKVELSRLSGASVPTVNKIVNQLECDGLVCGMDEDSHTLGRKAVRYIINKDAGYYIVLFIQNGSITAGLANDHGELVRQDVLHPDMTDLNDVNGSIFRIADSYRSSIPGDKLNSIGFGIPGVIDENHRIIAIPTVPCWEGIDLLPVFEERYHVPVYLENDVKLMTVGAYQQEFAETYKNMVLVYISKGLGAGIVINGRLYKGFRNFAGEFGYMIPDFERPVSHPEWTGDLELKLQPLAEKKIAGISLSESEQEQFINMLTGIVTNFTAVLNPEVIAVYAPNLSDADLSQIRQRTLIRIPDNCMPELTMIRNEMYGINGVVALCMSENKTTISLVDETGLQL